MGKLREWLSDMATWLSMVLDLAMFGDVGDDDRGPAMAACTEAHMAKLEVEVAKLETGLPVQMVLPPGMEPDDDFYELERQLQDPAMRALIAAEMRRQMETPGAIAATLKAREEQQTKVATAAAESRAKWMAELSRKGVS